MKTTWRRAVTTVPALIAGGVRYVRTGHTGEPAYQAMVRLFCLTQGRSNEFIHRAARLRRQAGMPEGGGVLDPLDLPRVVRALRSDGFYVFPNRLPEDTCRRLENLAREARGGVRRPLQGPAPTVYEPTRSGLETFWLDEDGLAQDETVQELVADPSFLRLAAAYLLCEPVLSILAMWWSRPSTDERPAFDDNAQLFHFDLDRPKWIKIFVYLTDVTTTSGPHVYVRGSHRIGAKPRSLLWDGYRRVSDQEIASWFPSSDIQEICGRRGTMFAADTSGYHKGKAPEDGERLVFQIEYADSLFGGEYRRVDGVRLRSAKLRTLLAEHPRTLARWSMAAR